MRILTYSDVVKESRLLACWLVSHGAAPRKVVVSLMEHCAEYMLAQLATFQAGAAFFALETHYGPQMLTELLQQTHPVAGFSSAPLRSRLHAALQSSTNAPTLSLDGTGWRQEAAAATAAVPPRDTWARAAPFDTGIITMTSGTSGKPKAIACPVVSFSFAADARNARYPYAAHDTDTLDRKEREAVNVMFVWEALRPLCFGQAAVVIPDRVILDATLLAPFLMEHAVTRFLSTPSLLATFLELAEMSATDSEQHSTSLSERLPRLRLWSLCGEVVPDTLVRRAATLLPAVKLVNDYSSWEGSDVSLATLQPSTMGERFASVGTLIPGVSCALLDPTTLKAVPRGVGGELYVHSPMMFTAYLGAADLTSQKLLPVPPALRAHMGLDGPGAGVALGAALLHAQGAKLLRDDALATADDELQPLMYRTGDLARVLPSGELQVLGRADSTVKIRGFKIGLGFVEATIGALPGVGRVAVVPLLDDDTNQPVALVAHVLPNADAAAAAEADQKGWLASLRSACRKELATHAVPAHWMLTKELGVSAGEARKLNRKALPKFQLNRVPNRRASAPARLMGVDASPTEALEAQLMPIWSELLNQPDMTAEESFFDLGGHSLLASKLVAAISRDLGVKLTVLDLFDAPTVRALAATLAPKPEVAASLSPQRPLAVPGAAGGKDLALIGMAGKFPGAEDIDAFWSMLAEGRDALTMWTKAELAAKGVGANVRDAPGFVPAAYIIDGAHEFDAAFWSISPQEAQLMDPQHRMFMQSAWAALEHAGYAPRSGSPARTAVFASAGIDGYMIHHLDGKPLKDTLSPGDIFLGEVGNEKDYISTRVSYALDLMGPSLSVNSACSSALSAVAQAGASLLADQADMAIGGGAALSFPSHGYLFEEGLVNSVDGKVRPFDAAAHGTVFGDAVGAVVLKRLADAVADDDFIYCVVRGFGLANDGARKAGYAAPGVAGQVAAVSAALRMAGVSASTISYVECHATGTLVGDGIELRALSDAFAAHGSGDGGVGYCAIGSVKGNIGHANAAAGVTGLIKAAMCLSKSTLVPTANYRNLNEKVVLQGGPFYVHEGGSKPWEHSEGAPRRAGVSSFGIGGSNAHFVLEEAPSRNAAALPAGVLAPAKRPLHVVSLSAKSRGALRRAANALAAHLTTSPASLSRVAHTLHLGRESFPQRLSIVAANAAQAVERLFSAAELIPSTGGPTPPPKAPSVLFIFPGQGSQSPRMGEGLYRGEPLYRAHVDRMCATLAPLLGFDLRDKLYPTAEAEAAPGFRAAFDTPTVTQPAIFVTELALGRTLLELGVRPVGMGGHSIGEFVAATLCGVLSEEDALTLIATRAALSESAPEGAMLACPIDPLRARAVVAEYPGQLWLAVQNAPRRQVLAGEVQAVAAAEAQLVADGIRCRKLPVTRAYHTPLMAGVQSALLLKLVGMELKAPAVPLACNGSGAWMSPETAVDPSYWAAHVATAVRWADNMDLLASRAPAHVLEIGAGSSLAPLLAECQAAGADELQPLATLRHPKVPFSEGAADAEAFGEALGGLWEAGASVDWRAYHGGERYLKLALPTYSFDPAVHWVNPQASMYVRPDAEAVAAAQVALDAAAAVKPSPAAPQLVRLRPAIAPEKKWVTSYCLAYAGGSTTAFAEFARAAPEWMEVVGIEMPGKGELADVPWPAEDIGGNEEVARAAEEEEAEMISTLADRLADDAAGSALVLVGWSMGGMLAAELALHLEAKGVPPQLVHVAGRMAPGSFVLAGDDVDKYLLASDEMKETDAWKEWLLPMLMADLRADARAEQRVASAWSTRAQQDGGAPPLRCMLQVCSGDTDIAFPPEAAAAWSGLTRGSFEKHTLAGGHDILQGRVLELLRLITSALLPASPLYSVQWRPLLESADGTATSELQRGSERVRMVRIDGSQPEGLHEASLPDLAAALGSASGLLVYLPSLPSVSEGEAQCWELLQLVMQLAAAGGAGRLVLLCPADGTSAALAAGASKAVPLEFPEITVQRLFLPAATDLLRSGGSFLGLQSVLQGWLGWVAAVAADHTAETDLWLDPSPPHAPLAPRLLPQARPPPSSSPAVDPNGTYLITGGSGGLGGAMVAWLLYEQGVPPKQLILLSRRGGASPHPGVRCVAADLSSTESLASCAALAELPYVTGIFHLAGVLDDGLILNMTRERLAKVVAPKAGLLPLLSLCAARRWEPAWVLAASSTSSLLGYAGQSNYCAANGLLDHAVTFGLPETFCGGRPAPKLLTLNFGPWGEVGMAREGTKAHQLSLQSGELPMASSAAISCIAEALRQLQTPASPSPSPGAPVGNGLQFAVADMEWWRSPWPSHPLLQGVLHRIPNAPTTDDGRDGLAEATASAAAGTATHADAAAGGVVHSGGGGEQGRTLVEGFLQSRLSMWEPLHSLLDLGLDSLDLVQLRNGFQKAFKLAVPLGVFTNANQTLAELLDKLAAKM